MLEGLGRLGASNGAFTGAVAVRLQLVLLLTLSRAEECTAEEVSQLKRRKGMRLELGTSTHVPVAPFGFEGSEFTALSGNTQQYTAAVEQLGALRDARTHLVSAVVDAVVAVAVGRHAMRISRMITSDNTKYSVYIITFPHSENKGQV